MPHKTLTLAKITPPRQYNIFPRTRLFQKLDKARKRPVIWVVAPPGAGKTTLIASYIKNRRIPSIWYQLDEMDGDSASFFHYLGLAAKKAAPNRRRPLPHLTPEYLLGLPTFTRNFFEDLYGRLKDPSMIVFDNYQAVPHDSNFHHLLCEGLSMTPETGNAVIISRVDPLPAFARMVANRSVEIIGWDDLMLTIEESRSIAEKMKIDLPARDLLQEIHDRSKGWVAGLILMIEQVRRKATGPIPIEGYGSQALFDYFLEEILKKMDRERQDLLLKTSLLPRMTAPMVERLTGYHKADEVLSDLNRHHFFMERRDGTIPVYQYHDLFREFLLNRVQATLTPEALSQLQAQAAMALEEAGWMEDAVELYLNSCDWPGGARLILDQAPQLISQGRNQTLIEWFGHLPQGMYDQDPWLGYWLGVCHLPIQPKRARQILEGVFERFKEKEEVTGPFLSWSAIAESYIILWDTFADFDRWILELEQLLSRYQLSPSKEIEANVLSSLVFALINRQPHNPKFSYWVERLLGLMDGEMEVNNRIKAGGWLVN